MLDTGNGLHNGFKRFRHQFDSVFRPQPISADVDVHHRNRDLRLFLARQSDQRDKTKDQRRQKEQGRQRTGDKGTRQVSGNAGGG